MAELVEQLFHWVQYVTEWLGYPGIFLLMLLENLVPPIPSELVMPLAGSLVADGRLSAVGVLLSGSLGSALGAVILYRIGHKLSRRRLERWTCRYGKFVFLSVEDLQRALDLFQRHGKLTVFLARLVPGVRSLISIPAGINRMPFASFFVLTMLGTLIWNSLLAGSGVLLGHNWERVLSVVDAYELVLLVGIGVLLLLFLLRKFQQRSSPESSGCEELENIERA